MYKAIIIEDERNASLALDFLIKSNFNDIEVSEICSSIPEGVLAINKHNPDIVFLDIEMPVYSGFDLFKFIKEPNFSVIFTTAYSQYAIKAFEVSAVDYILKPVDEDALKKAVEKAKSKQDKELLLKKVETLQENTTSERIKSIALPLSDSLAFVETNTIEYIEAVGVYTRVHLTDKSQLLISKNIKVFEDMLNKDDRFYRVHRSHIVNLEQISSYIKRDRTIKTNSGAIIKVAREKKPDFEDAISKIRV